MRRTLRRTMLAILCLTLATLAWSPMSRAAETREELQKRFHDRLPQVEEQKKMGTIGETSEGYLDYVEGPGGKAVDLVADENGDRRKLYELIAVKAGTTADVVAKRAAQRNFERAKNGEFLKEAGKWRRKS